MLYRKTEFKIFDIYRQNSVTAKYKFEKNQNFPLYEIQVASHL